MLQKLRISVKAYESNILDSSCVKIVEAIKASGIEAVGPIPLPTNQHFVAFSPVCLLKYSNIVGINGFTLKP